MAVNISFKLREPQKEVPPSKQKESSIIMMVNFGYFESVGIDTKKYIPLKYSTGEKIKPTNWTGKRAKQTSQIEFKNLNTRLDKLEEYAKESIRELLNEEIILTPENVKEKIDEKNPKIIKNIPKAINLNEYIKQFIDEIEKGVRLSLKKQRYGIGTVKNFKGFKVQFDLYQDEKGKKLDFNHINQEFYNEFVDFFVNKNYSPNTIGRHIKNLKTIMHFSRDEDLHSNIEIDKRNFKILKVDVENVYLEEKELKKLFELDLKEKPNWDLARDVFLVGCYTAQRFSDYSRIRKENIKKLNGANYLLELVQQKTGEKVIIPLKKEAISILEKYKFTFPKTYEQKVNSYIKKVAEKAEINESILIESIKGGNRVKETVLKFDIIKTHTARRTGCTNMYLAGIPIIDIMKISGHKTEREFLKYIKIGKEETANKLLNHPFFK